MSNQLIKTNHPGNQPEHYVKRSLNVRLVNIKARFIWLKLVKCGCHRCHRICPICHTYNNNKLLKSLYLFILCDVCDVCDHMYTWVLAHFHRGIFLGVTSHKNSSLIVTHRALQRVTFVTPVFCTYIRLKKFLIRFDSN